MLRLISVALLAALFVPGSRLHAQQDAPHPRERWQVTLEGEHYVWDIGLVRLDGDSLVVRQADTLARLPVEHITEIRLIQSSTVDLGAGAAGGESGPPRAPARVYRLSTPQIPAGR